MKQKQKQKKTKQEKRKINFAVFLTKVLIL